MSYNPATSVAIAQPQTQPFARFFSQRELSIDVPVNFVTHPGVVLTAACFAHGRYDSDATIRCVSNLLASGFRRIDADIFWDASRLRWSLCPVELDDNGSASPLPISSSISTTPRQVATSLSTNFITERAIPVTARNNPHIGHLNERQTSADASTSTDAVVETSIAAPTTSVTSSANPTAATSVINPGGGDVNSTSAGQLHNVRSYSCTAGTDVQLLVDVLYAYLQNTENKLNATTLVLTLNIHVAAPASDPNGSPLRPSDEQLPSGGSLLSNIIAPNSTAYLYTPGELLSQRADLNASGGWFAVDEEAQPRAEFFTVNTTNSRYSTPDGWPSESYIELEKAQRLLVGFGDVDPQLADYDSSLDEAFIFPSHYLTSPRTVTFDPTGNVTSGCFFDPADTSLTSQNSSWAVSNIGNGTVVSGSALQSILDQARNLTYCGISPILNSTLDNVTAAESPDQYAAFVQSTVWSWGPGEPANASSSDDDSRGNNCAAMNATSGTWQALDCSGIYRGACRIGGEPYSWRISADEASYAKIDLLCDDGTTFDAPRTSLENSHLLSTWVAWRAARPDTDDNDDDASAPLLWLDFNDLDVATCWVIGQNASCPYSETAPNRDQQEIVVPVVGAFVVFFLAALTVLVKCAGNRQQSKRRRRRGEDGWDYEGVPS